MAVVRWHVWPRGRLPPILPLPPARSWRQVWDGMEQAGATVLLSARDSTAGVVRQR